MVNFDCELESRALPIAVTLVAMVIGAMVNSLIGCKNKSNKIHSKEIDTLFDKIENLSTVLSDKQTETANKINKMNTEFQCSIQKLSEKVTSFEKKIGNMKTFESKLNNIENKIRIFDEKFERIEFVMEHSYTDISSTNSPISLYDPNNVKSRESEEEDSAESAKIPPDFSDNDVPIRYNHMRSISSLVGLTIKTGDLDKENKVRKNSNNFLSNLTKKIDELNCDTKKPKSEGDDSDITYVDNDATDEDDEDEVNEGEVEYDSDSCGTVRVHSNVPSKDLSTIPEDVSKHDFRERMPSELDAIERFECL